MMAKPLYKTSLLTVLTILFLSMISGCDQSPQSNPASGSQTSTETLNLSPNTLTYPEILARAPIDEKSFTALIRLLLKQSVLFAVETSDESGGAAGSSKKFSIKVTQSEDAQLPNAALLFSSKASLAAAGKKFNWEPNEDGMYSYIMMNGQDAFKVLMANGYARAVLDAANPNAFTFTERQMRFLADGETPAFYESA